jgi:hypothetical protein
LDIYTFDTIPVVYDLTDTQIGLIERLREGIKVNDTNRAVLKQIEELFLQVNKGACDGELSAEEEECILVFHFEQIENFLGGKRSP